MEASAWRDARDVIGDGTVEASLRQDDEIEENNKA